MLRWIAMIAMAIDHMAFYFYDVIPEWLYFLGRGIGRLAMPIFAYYLARGFRRTRNLIRYFLRLLLTGGLTQVVVMHLDEMMRYRTDLRLNFIFDMLIGLLFLAGWELATKAWPDVMVRLQPVGPVRDDKKNLPFQARINLFGLEMKPHLGLFFGGIIMVSAAFLAGCLPVDYGLYGVAMIFGFYLAEEEEAIALKKDKAIHILLYVTIFFIAPDIIGEDPFFAVSSMQIFALLALPLIYFFRAKEKPRAPQRRSLFQRYFGYLFYPLHFYIIYFLRFVVFDLGPFFSNR